MANGEQIVFKIGADVVGLTTGAQKGVASLASLEKQAKLLEKQVQQIGRAGVEFQRSVNAWAGVTDKAGKSARESAAAFEKWGEAKDAVDDLRASLDPAYAATLRFQQAALKLDSALDMGAISAQEHANTMALLKARMVDVDAGATRAAGGSRMLMMQLSQVGQQAMASGNIVQALAIQLPDIGLAFGAVGAAAGLLAGVALPMLMSAFGDTGEAAKAAQKAFDDMDAAVSAYQSAIKDAVQSTADLRAEYALTGAEARAALTAMADVERIKAIQAINAAVLELRRSLMDQVLEVDAFGNAVIVGYELADTFGMAADAADRFGAAMAALATAGGMKEQGAAAREAAAALREAYGSVDAMPAPLQVAYQRLLDIELQAAAVERAAQNIASALSAAKTAAATLQGTVASLSGTMASAASGAWELARGMWDAARAKAALGTPQQQMDRANKVYGRVGARGDPRSFGTDGAAPFVPAEPGRGGGGGGENPLIGDLEQLRNALATKEQLEMESFARRQETLRLALAQQLITQQEYAALMQEAQRQHADAMSQIDVYRYGTGMEKAGQFFGDMAAAAQSGGGRLLAIAKSFGAAQALVAAYQAAAQALATPGITPLGQLAAYAKILGAGLSAVSAIKGVTAGGGTSGGGRAGGGASAASVPTPAYTANVTLVGNSFTGDNIAQLFRDLNEGLGRGFNINLARA